VNFRGTQVVMDMYNCALDTISDQSEVKKVMETTADHFHFEVINLYYNPTAGTEDYSYLMPCLNGHIILYVFPSLGYVSADIFSTRENTNTELIAIFIRKKFAPDQAKLTLLNRGDFGTINDMKPRRRKHIRPIRRATEALKKLGIKSKV
jgi:S-adenosylmethionine decarboxylase